MAVFQSADLVTLFQTYTANEGSIGAHLSDAAVQGAAGDPLVVATGTDMALFPGRGAPPTVESFRLSTRGFKELAAVSHLGPALASLVRMNEISPASGTWRADAVRLLQATERARAANSTALWRDGIAVEAYAGREAAIAAMVDYGCALTLRFLRAVLADEAKLTSEHLRAAYLQARDRTLGASVPFNAVMIATFFLTGLDIAFRITRWFKAQAVDWQRAMVLVVGQQGRPTSGVTWTSNSICQMILSTSDHALPLDRMYIAPHAPGFKIDDPDKLDAVKACEAPMRRLWCYTRAIAELGPAMFADCPRYAPESFRPPLIGDDTTRLSEMPRITGPDDFRSMTARLRLVMEDPRQLLSGCVTDYAAEQLRLNGNDPCAAVVPGLDGCAYPTDL